MASSVFNTVDPRGVKRSGKVQTFSGVTSEDRGGANKGMTMHGVVVGKVWGADVVQWRVVERVAQWFLAVVYGILAVYAIVICPMAVIVRVLASSGASEYVDDGVVAVVVGIRNGVCVYVVQPLVGIIGPVALVTSLCCVAVLMLLRVEYGGANTYTSADDLPVVSLSFRESWADTLLVLFAAISFLIPHGVIYVLAVFVAAYCAGIYHTVCLKRVRQRRGEMVELVVVVALVAAASFGALPFVAVRRVIQCMSFESRSAVREPALGFPNTYRQISEVLGIDMSNAEKIYKAADLRVLYCGGSNAPAESPDIRRLALLGDRILSLALARRAVRERWTVEEASNKCQFWLSNAAFACVWEAYLSAVFPQLAVWKESRKGTLVEALVGISYLSTGNVDNIEDFIFSRVAPVVIAKGGMYAT